MARNFGVAACFLIALLGAAHAKLIGDIGTTSLEEVNSELALEIAGRIPEHRIAGLAAVLGPVFKTLPKNADGRVGHQAVRYALHRLFVKRHGWYIKGLEGNKADNGIKDGAWIPSYLQDKLEEHLGNHGMNLHELAALGAALEDLIRNEAEKRMKDVYDILELKSAEPVGMTMAIEALDTYAMAYLLSGKMKNISLVNQRDTERKLKIFADKYKNYTEFHAWFQVLEQQHLNTASSSDKVEFGTMTRLAQDFGERYATFNDIECKALKSALLAQEGQGRGVGRVKLSDFYNMSRYSHWKLNEKQEYLKDLGALDDTNASNPLVIVPNYVTSRPNCLEATPLYALCCRDECEDLIGRLERDLKEPKAHPDQIVALISTYPSDTVKAPRTLSDTLLRHLNDIAALHGGDVDVHSRLFAQWMHHAFPRECPYPHESGTTSPQTADEWMKTNGHKSEQASEEDVQKVLDDACKAPIGDGELPWNPNEEMLDGQVPAQPINALLAVFLFTSGLWGLLISQGFWHRRFGTRMRMAEAKLTALAFCSVMLLAAGAIVIDLVDKILVAAVFVIGMVFHFGSQHMNAAAQQSSKCCDVQDDKLV